MRLVYKYLHLKDKQLEILIHISKNLYNETNYLIKKELETNKRWIRYFELNKILKKSSVNYKLLKAQTSQQILKLIDKNWTSFFTTIKDWKKHPKKYKGKPNPPFFKKKEECFLLIFTNQNYKIENYNVILTMVSNFK
jgi:putative transposase